MTDWLQLIHSDDRETPEHQLTCLPMRRSLQQRMRRHFAHAKACGCRDIPLTIAEESSAVRSAFPEDVAELHVGTGRRALVLLVPVALVLTMYGIFHAFTRVFGLPLGYLLSFVIYWLGWCGIVPMIVLGRRGVVELFEAGERRFRQLGLRVHVLLWLPLVFPFLFAFVPRLRAAGAPVLFVSIGLGIVIGITEEILWRGLYVRLFPENVWANTVYPSIAFGLWHLCPLSVLPSRYPGGPLLFLLYSVILGACYATAARTTRSIRWVAVSHTVHDTLGLGAFAYAAWLT